MAKKPVPFAKETDLCAAFLAGVAKTGGWTAYAETAGWDILLVRDADGFQIGIEAKLKLNAEVIAQALEDGYWPDRSGPDCRAVLVPEDSARGGFDKIAAYIGFTIIRVATGSTAYCRPPFMPSLPKIEDRQWGHNDWHELCPTKRYQLPEYVPDVAAGSSAPLQLTSWKIAAIKIAVTIEKRGYVTRTDFKHHGIDHRRWIASVPGWLKIENGRYVANRMPDFKRDHPRVYAEIAADAEKWLPSGEPPMIFTGA